MSLFHPNLGVCPGVEAQTYAMFFEGVSVWRVFVESVKNSGYVVFGRRIRDEDNVSENDDGGTLWLDVATDMPKKRFLRLYERSRS